ncbi:MAG TPA: gamma-glutamylcyclotransferase family protein [Gemmataceae bacterium]|nr:gamma-glutamylcyclotransferase family protein [Gemmataceae bacterium]
MKTILFVYGTLKRGMKNHALLAGQSFLRTARSEPGYRLLDLGRYPGLIEDVCGGVAIEGELWEADEPTLAKLDKFEDVPNLFQRRSVAIESFVGEVQAYFYVDSSNGLDCGNSWPPAATHQGDKACS